MLLVVDGYLVLRGEFDDLEAKLIPLAAQGLSYGMHLALSATRWSELRPALKDLLGGRIELRLGEAAESEVDRRRAAAVPRPGHGLAADGAPAVVAAPRLSAGETDLPALVAAVADGWPGPGFAPVQLLPDRIDLGALPAAAPGVTGIPLGVDEERLGRVELDLSADPYLLGSATPSPARPAFLRQVARIVTAYTPGAGPDPAGRLPARAARRGPRPTWSATHQHADGDRGGGPSGRRDARLSRPGPR